MTDVLRFILPGYFVLYFGVAFLLKSLLTARRIGKSPVTLPNDDSAYALVGLYFKVTLAAIFSYTSIFALFPAWHHHFLPIRQLRLPIVTYTGLILMAISLLWTVVAQSHMKNSWRIGIDAEMKTALITTGLFSISRNPIFLGMILSLAGLFLVTPDALTALFLIVGYILIQIQIRLEEEFLSRAHGQKYFDYKRRVRRLM